MLKRAVTVRTQYEGIHCWPEAPVEVGFLRSPHRHIFQIRANIEVEHNDRDVEFIMVKHRIDNWLKTKCVVTGEYDSEGSVWDMGRMSCEDVAEQVIEVICDFVGSYRTITVFVSEDGENEAMLQYIPDEDLLEQDGYTMNVSVPRKTTDIVSLQDYQEKSYIAIQKHDSNKEEVMHWAIGLGEEAGEVLSVIKHKYYGGKYDIEDLVNELGDALWHIAALCTAQDIDLADVVAYNMAKLNYRYPSGMFDNERSVQRHDVDRSFKGTDEHNKIMMRILGTN